MAQIAGEEGHLIDADEHHALRRGERGHAGLDLLSPLLNMGWLALALLAAWCMGSRFGLAPVTLTGVAVALGTPGLVATQPGGGYDDVVGLALLLLANGTIVAVQSGLALL